MKAIEVTAGGITKDVALGIGRSLWIAGETLDEVFDKYGQHFGEFGDFLIAVGRLAYCKDEILRHEGR